MKQLVGWKPALAVGFALAVLAGTSSSEPVAFDKVPEAVANTFRSAFPNGTIAKLDVEEENGVMVYDFEFTAGDREKECDIAGDGTMIESTLVVAAKDIPAPALKTIKKVAGKATLGRLEWLETFYELEAGKLMKLEKSEIHYAAEMHRGGQMAEVFVDPAGKITEKPKWAPETPAKAPTSGSH